MQVVGSTGRRDFSPDLVKTIGGSMSLFYGMSVEVSGYLPEATDTIKDAAASEWPFGDWSAPEVSGQNP